MELGVSLPHSQQSTTCPYPSQINPFFCPSHFWQAQLLSFLPGLRAYQHPGIILLEILPLTLYQGALFRPGREADHTPTSHVRKISRELKKNNSREIFEKLHRAISEKKIRQKFDEKKGRKLRETMTTAAREKCENLCWDIEEKMTRNVVATR